MIHTPNSRKRLSRVSRFFLVILMTVAPLLIAETAYAQFFGTGIGTTYMDGISSGFTNMTSGQDGTACDNASSDTPDVVYGSFICPDYNTHVGLTIPSKMNGLNAKSDYYCNDNTHTFSSSDFTFTTGNMSLNPFGCFGTTHQGYKTLEFDVPCNGTPSCDNGATTGCEVVVTMGTPPSGGWGSKWGCTYDPPSNYCLASDIRNAAGSFTLDSSGTSGALDIRFDWSLTTPPVPSSFDHWDIYFPGDKSGAHETMSTANTVDGSPNTYFEEWTGVTAHTPLNALIQAPDIGSHLGCQLLISLSSNPINKTPTDTSTGGTGDTSGSGGPNCGFSLNPFHYLKCLFEPTDTMQRWNSFASTAQSHPPISVIVGGYSFVTSTFSAFTAGPQGTANCATTGVSCPLVEGGVGGTFADPTGINSGAHRMDIVGAAGDDVQNNTWGHATYVMLEYAFVLGTFIGIWRMVSASFGGKGSAD